MPKKALPAAVSIKIPRGAYRTAQRLAKREQRTITTTVERAIAFYASSTTGDTEGKAIV